MKAEKLKELADKVSEAGYEIIGLKPMYYTDGATKYLLDGKIIEIVPIREDAETIKALHNQPMLVQGAAQ